MIIQAYALSDLKRIREKTANNSDSRVTHIFNSHNLLNDEWIKPLNKGFYYKGKKEYQFTVGTDEDFFLWRNSLSQIIHDIPLEVFIKNATNEMAFYNILTCSTVETIFGPTICKQTFEELVAGWKHLILLQEEDIDGLTSFCHAYIQWTRCFYLGQQNGVVEIF